jgi:hypothetical protein
MKFEEKIDRRRFLKQGLCWGLLAGLLPLWTKTSGDRSANEVRPAPARHWRELAG